jgi:molybdopterin-guanine dinucleotide biosynthesis protein
MKPTFVNSPQPAIRTVVIAGTSSNTGKTTLLCDLLRELGRDEKWEAIKLTRGHYRSCGKDPQACCVSPLLGDQPIVRSGRDETYAPGKDTGRYWEAGASDVHWVIATDNQVEQGIRTALARVTSGRVLIEGTTLLKLIEADLVVMV